MDELHWFINQDVPQNKGDCLMISTGRESDEFLGSPGHGSRINQILSDLGLRKPGSCHIEHLWEENVDMFSLSF